MLSKGDGNRPYTNAYSLYQQIKSLDMAETSAIIVYKSTVIVVGT